MFDFKYNTTPSTPIQGGNNLKGRLQNYWTVKRFHWIKDTIMKTVTLNTMPNTLYKLQ
jgi:hypothetical protein